MRKTIRFESEGLFCAGWFYIPDEAKHYKVPAIVMAHGFSLVKEAYLDLYAEKFKQAGFAVLVFDYRNFGESDMTKPFHLDPLEQIKDYRNAVSWVMLQDEVDHFKVGIWGTSYSGGHVLHVGAVDSRIKAVVAQVPTINGRKGALRKMGHANFKEFVDTLTTYRNERYQQKITKMLPVVSLKEPSAQPHPDAYKWFMETKAVAPNWQNEITLESMEHYMEYNPTSFLEFISPTPVMMIAAMEDGITPPDLIIEAYEEWVQEPKSLVKLVGGHFDVYNGPTFEEASNSAVAWFTEHLKKVSVKVT